MWPPRQTGLPAARQSGLASLPGAGQSFDAIKTRVLARLEDRTELTHSKRMPPSILRQGLRTAAEQAAEIEARGMGRVDRDRLVDEVLSELLGFGPLEELFRDDAGALELIRAVKEKP